MKCVKTALGRQTQTEKGIFFWRHMALIMDISNINI